MLKFKLLLEQILLESNFQSIVDEAIENGWLLRITYKGKGANRPRSRVVEPFTAGTYRASGKQVFVAWHNRGFSLSQDKPEWRVYNLDSLTKCVLLKHNKIDGSKPAKGARLVRPGYNPPDKRLSNITADIINNFKPVKDPSKQPKVEPDTKAPNALTGKKPDKKTVDPTLVDKEDESEKEINI